MNIADGMRGSESLDTSECGKQDNDRLGERHREFAKEAAVRKEREGCRAEEGLNEGRDVLYKTLMGEKKET